MSDTTVVDPQSVAQRLQVIKTELSGFETFFADPVHASDAATAQLDRLRAKIGQIESLLNARAPAETAAAGGDGASAPLSEDPGICAAPEDEEAAICQISDEFGAFWGQVCLPSESDQAISDERAAIAAQRERIGQMYASGPLTPERLVEIGAELARLGNLVRTAQQIAALEENSPEAATEARQAMTGFDEELGPGTIVTPELIAQFEAEKAVAEAAETTAQEHMAAAEALPDGPEKDAALDAAMQEMMQATVDRESAESRIQAARGKQMLTSAITTGPLSPYARRPIADQSAAQFIEAYTRNPDLADFAVGAARDSANPDAIAAGMDMLCTNVAGGFPDDSGTTPPAPFDAQGYAQNLINGASAEGGDYMADAADYIRDGGHLQQNPIPDGTGRDANGRERARSNYLADAAIGADGTLDVTSPAAQKALGHLRFNPDVVDEPTASLNAHVMSTYDMLSEPDNQTRAQGILNDIEEPQGAGRTLVARSSGAAAADVDADDTRQAVVAALMTPVHQGNVGSCFATAGVRRMSTLEPLESMEFYAELAETGTFRPRNRLDPIPAVMSFPADENPLIRSMEYSAATVMTQMEENSRHDMLQNALNESVDNLIGPVGDDGAIFSAIGTDNWHVDQALIRATLIRSFMVEYDATRRTAPSADGSSSSGVYMLIQTEGPGARRVIDSQSVFVAALTERVLFAIGEPAGTDKAKEISDTIQSQDYLDDLMSRGMTPWNMGGGGMPQEADEILFGDEQETDELLDGRDGWDDFTGVTQGDRTEELLENMLESFHEDHQGDGMVPIMNRGIHAFNGLPDHPSLAPLMQGDIEDNIEAQLLAPGREIAASQLTEAEVLTACRATIDSIKSWDPSGRRRTMLENAIGNGVGADLTPQQVDTAIMAALQPYLTTLCLDQANVWRQQEIAAGRACTTADRDAHAASIRPQWEERISGGSVGGIAAAAAPPTVTVADTNWGDATQDVMFVMAPDPRTGELQLWKQYNPPGNLVPMGEDWVDAGWTEHGAEE
ncbi:hypothetical protein [Actibacterium ureilyticum]|uniref:hypothetical protein n=1 Tax=Actibacterium ureilyticum TaxID=1590614 RepID=UPI000BAAE0E1|nr:hypothetical protein [Actibacterium ureilyticum]